MGRKKLGKRRKASGGSSEKHYENESTPQVFASARDDFTLKNAEKGEEKPLYQRGMYALSGISNRFRVRKRGQLWGEGKEKVRAKEESSTRRGYNSLRWVTCLLTENGKLNYTSQERKLMIAVSPNKKGKKS